MMMRCQALLGTFVEITIEEGDCCAVDDAFSAIKQIQDLMGFHNPLSELNQINRWAHQVSLQVHPWNAEVPINVTLLGIVTDAREVQP